MNAFPRMTGGMERDPIFLRSRGPVPDDDLPLNVFRRPNRLPKKKFNNTVMRAAIMLVLSMMFTIIYYNVTNYHIGENNNDISNVIIPYKPMESNPREILLLGLKEIQKDSFNLNNFEECLSNLCLQVIEKVKSDILIKHNSVSSKQELIDYQPYSDILTQHEPRNIISRTTVQNPFSRRHSYSYSKKRHSDSRRSSSKRNTYKNTIFTYLKYLFEYEISYEDVADFYEAVDGYIQMIVSDQFHLEMLINKALKRDNEMLIKKLANNHKSRKFLDFYATYSDELDGIVDSSGEVDNSRELVTSRRNNASGYNGRRYSKQSHEIWKPIGGTKKMQKRKKSNSRKSHNVFSSVKKYITWK
jgi:hypothetical protein